MSEETPDLPVPPVAVAAVATAETVAAPAEGGGSTSVVTVADPDVSGSGEAPSYLEASVPDAVAAPPYLEAVVPGAGANITPWPTDEPPDTTNGPGTDGGHDAHALSPAPTHADWRQLADEVRRLAEQIAHGRA